jgi:hypothetical protein
LLANARAATAELIRRIEGRDAAGYLPKAGPLTLIARGSTGPVPDQGL